jgi:aspartyl/asparaginyl beta-hydroxylase (cupin superfamily)
MLAKSNKTTDTNVTLRIRYLIPHSVPHMLYNIGTSNVTLMSVYNGSCLLLAISCLPLQQYYDFLNESTTRECLYALAATKFSKSSWADSCVRWFTSTNFTDIRTPMLATASGGSNQLSYCYQIPDDGDEVGL